MKSIGEQLADLLGVSQFARGAWFSISNEHLFVGHKRWSFKDGRHPVVLVRVGGPNVTVFARSSTVKTVLTHAPHPIRHEVGCCITKKGFISTAAPMRVDARVLTNKSFSCYEPPSTGLLAEIGIVT